MQIYRFQLDLVKAGLSLRSRQTSIKCNHISYFETTNSLASGASILSGVTVTITVCLSEESDKK